MVGITDSSSATIPIFPGRVVRLIELDEGESFDVLAVMDGDSPWPLAAYRNGAKRWEPQHDFGRWRSPILKELRRLAAKRREV